MPSVLRWPAGVRAALRGGQTLEAEAEEGRVGGESGVAQRGHAVQLLEQALPVRLDGHRARRVLAVQVRVQDVDGLLVDRGLELAGEEGRPGQLLRTIEKRNTVRKRESRWCRWCINCLYVAQRFLCSWPLQVLQPKKIQCIFSP